MTKSALALLGGLGLGAGLMYVLDPQAGSRRRALVRDKLTRAVKKGGAAASARARDLRNRTLGLAAEARARLGRDGGAPDRVLGARVRSELGHVVSHPRSIDVTARGGHVTLSGPVLAHEADALVARVSRVQGVTSVETRLDVRDRPGAVPGLQGGVRRLGRRFEFWQANWSPAARLLGGAVGAALTLYGAARRGVLGTATGLAGASLFARAATNLEMKRLLGVGAGRRAVDVRKTIAIMAPVEQVFEFWRRYENFPRFMSHVREVCDLGGGRSRWTVAGPGGVPVEWDAVITQHVPFEVLAWKTVPGAVVEHAGIVRFAPTRDGGTRVDIQMAYNPPAGAVGHGLAALFGADPESRMHADLARLKTLIETGRAPHDAARSASRESSWR